jgi:low temperature requirement protein LtrA
MIEGQWNRSVLWTVGHLLLFDSIAATGAGLHVAAYYIEDVAVLGTVVTVLAVVGPVAMFVLAPYGIGSAFLQQYDPFHLLLLAGTAVVLVAAVVGAGLGVSVP